MVTRSRKLRAEVLRVLARRGGPRTTATILHRLNPQAKHPCGPLLASETDDKGYTVQAYDGADEQARVRFAKKRRGMIFILAPQGQTVFAGYWMDFPEEEWAISEHDYYTIPLNKRAELECQEQVCKYKLSCQFKTYSAMGRMVYTYETVCELLQHLVAQRLVALTFPNTPKAKGCVIAAYRQPVAHYSVTKLYRDTRKSKRATKKIANIIRPIHIGAE